MLLNVAGIFQLWRLIDTITLNQESNYESLVNMAHGHGGRRMGSGRPAGATTSGREVRAVARAALSTIIGTDKDPLVVLIDIATDETQPVPLRLEAAAVATRYIHPTLSAAAIQHLPAPSDGGQAVQVLLDRLASLAPSSAPVIDGEPVPAKVAS